MLKKTIEYTDFNGTDRKEEFYFNLTQAELMEMELGTSGGYGEMLQNIVNAQDTPAIVEIFKNLILKSYGEKSPDGKRFMKVNDAGVPLHVAFSQTEAYSKLFMELARDTDAATNFVNGIIPKNMEN